MPSLITLLDEISNCQYCTDHLPLGANPVVRAHEDAVLMIIGQAPGTRVHQTGIPWNDASGKRLREWLAIDSDTFYNPEKVAIMPMGFCYPGKGKSGDLPPRKECAPKWHDLLWKKMPNIQLTLLIGQYAQHCYLQDDYSTLTERVKHWKDSPAGFLPLPHPSPRNRLWLKKNAWFEQQVIPCLRQQVHRLI